VEVDVQLESVVSPRTELHLADLNVEREVPDVNGAGRAEDGRRDPGNTAVGHDDCHTVTMFLKSRVSTE